MREGEGELLEQVSGGSSSRSTAATTTTAATATDLSIALHLYESLDACFVCPRASITTDGVSSSVINDQMTVFPLLPASGRQQGGGEREDKDNPFAKLKRERGCLSLLFFDSTQAAVNGQGISHRFPIAACCNSY